MPDDKTIRGPEDARRINVHEPYEVRDWCRSLNCTKEELEDTVKHAGTYADKVREYLQK